MVRADVVQRVKFAHTTSWLASFMPAGWEAYLRAIQESWSFRTFYQILSIMSKFIRQPNIIYFRTNYGRDSMIGLPLTQILSTMSIQKHTRLPARFLCIVRSCVYVIVWFRYGQNTRSDSLTVINQFKFFDLFEDRISSQNSNISVADRAYLS